MRRKPSVAFVIFIVLSFFANKGFAQINADAPVRIAVLAPLYLDSAFVNDELKYNSSLPKYMLPGLDFYNGVMMAVDSMQKENVEVEVWVYDTRKKGQTVEDLEHEMEEQNFSLIIASISNVAEQQSLSSFAFNKNIPFISATYPNDAGISSNPFFIIVNSTLKTHVESIYDYVQRNYVGDKVYYVTRKGQMEERIKNYFDAMKSKTYPLKYKTIVLPDNFTAANLLPLIDSTTESVVICGSLDENFGLNLVHILSTAPSSNQLTAVGMPTWEGLKELWKDDCRNVNLVFSTPYHFDHTDNVIAQLTSLYQAKFNNHPGDMVFKGFEEMYHFTHLLLVYKNSLPNNLSDHSFKIANDFDFQPVRLSTSSYVPDYLENKKVYFVKLLNGSVISIN